MNKESKRNICIMCGNKNSFDYSKRSGDVTTVFIPFNCSRCGEWEAKQDILSKIGMLKKYQKAALSKKARIAFNNHNKRYTVLESNLKDLNRTCPAEQGNELIIFLGNIHSTNYGYIEISGEILYEIYAMCSCDIGFVEQNTTYNYLCDGLVNAKLLERNGTDANTNIRLTFEGWQKYNQLSALQSDSKTIFMAMNFPNKDLQPQYEYLSAAYELFKQEVTKTGFVLHNPLLEIRHPGSIDNRLSLEIRKARCVVADLTYDNSGVYWEAGFAQGLGKKVFYTCHEGAKNKTHFDVSHHDTIFWEEGNAKEAAEILRDSIRNAFPEDAKLEDPE